jgi:hypothetical protein
MHAAAFWETVAKAIPWCDMNKYNLGRQTALSAKSSVVIIAITMGIKKIEGDEWLSKKKIYKKE